MLKKSTAKILLKTESGLEDIVNSEYHFLLRNELQSNENFRDQYTNTWAVQLRKSVNIISGSSQILINSVIGEFSEDIGHKSIDFLNELFSRVISKMGTITSFSIILNEISTNNLVLKKSKRDNIKLDDFIFREEMDHAKLLLEKFDGLDIFPNKHLNKISVYIGDDLGFGSIQKQINDISLKYMRDLISKEATENKKIRPLFLVICTKKVIFLCLSFQIMGFSDKLLFSSLQRHTTPLSPHIAYSMIFQTLNSISRPDNTILATEKYSKGVDLVIIDPFCGYATIPLSAYAHSRRFLKLLNAKISSYNVYGFDEDPIAIEKSLENLQRLKDTGLMPKQHLNISQNIFFKQIPVRDVKSKFKPKNIMSPFYIIITQPPYGLTISKSHEELVHNYFGLLDFFVSLNIEKCSFLCLICANQDKFEDVLNNYNQDFQKKNFKLNIALKTVFSRRNNDFEVYLLKKCNF